MSEYAVAATEEIGEGDWLVVELEGKEVGVFNLDGEYHAYLNWCAHQSGPVCEGTRTGTIEATFDPETLTQESVYCREDEILNCPWHGWEYDLRTGECLSRNGVTLPEFPVHVEEGQVLVTLP